MTSDSIFRLVTTHQSPSAILAAWESARQRAEALGIPVTLETCAGHQIAVFQMVDAGEDQWMQVTLKAPRARACTPEEWDRAQASWKSANHKDGER